MLVCCVDQCLRLMRFYNAEHDLDTWAKLTCLALGLSTLFSLVVQLWHLGLTGVTAVACFMG